MKERDWNKVTITLIIGFAIISFWRGIWGLWDEYIFPSNYKLSLWIFLIVGFIILYYNISLIESLN